MKVYLLQGENSYETSTNLAIYQSKTWANEMLTRVEEWCKDEPKSPDLGDGDAVWEHFQAAHSAWRDSCPVTGHKYRNEHYRVHEMELQ